MPIKDLLLSELDEEMKKTRTMLERVPADKKDFTPHSKSMPLGRLAPHVAELAGFGLTVLTSPGLDFAQGNYKPLPLESAEQLVRVFDEGSAKVRQALQNISDDAWNENWKLSAHYQRSMTCSTCHDPHTAGMKSVAGSQNSMDASDLCANCHKDAMNYFPTSKHAEAGVTCVNCHLGFNVNNAAASATDFANAHKAPDHSFLPTLDTCNACHANQMHAPGQAVAAAAILAEEVGGTPTPQPSPVAITVPSVNTQPAPVSPAGYAGLAALLGLAGGMVLSPWLERLYRRLSSEKKDNKK